MISLKGIGVSPGIAIGKAVVQNHASAPDPTPIRASSVNREVNRFNRAVARTREEFEMLREKTMREIGGEYGEIFATHLAFLKDRLLIDGTRAAIRNELMKSEAALARSLERIAALFRKTPDALMEGRHRDIVDVVDRIMAHLAPARSAGSLPRGSILVAPDLSPSQTAHLDARRVRGFATDIGSSTSHSAILARALQIPAVVGLGQITRVVQTGQTLILDGREGTVIVDPSPAVLARYRRARGRLAESSRQMVALRRKPAETIDGKRIRVDANIELPGELPAVQKYGGDGIGLYRTEFLYLNRRDLPSEEEQVAAYRLVVEQMAGRPVTIRTLDIGGDKFASALEMPAEINPFLGSRAIRFCLQRTDVFMTQLRAILRASAYGNLRMMLPMVSTLDEILETKSLLRAAMDELGRKGCPFAKKISVGAMIETPAAALTASRLAAEVDFLSIGTNDLIQYTMAVDRINEKIAHLYQPCHPAVLSLIHAAIEGGHARGIPVGMCGEMASVPEYACLMVGMDIDELSMAPLAIPGVKRVIRRISAVKAQEIAQHAASLHTHEEVVAYLKEALKEELA